MPATIVDADSRLGEPWFWLSWFLGPGMFGAALLEGFGVISFGPPYLFSFLTLPAHYVAAMVTLALFVVPGPRRNLECWLLLPLYWTSLVLGICCGDRHPALGLMALLVCAAVVPLGPGIRVIRRVLAGRAQGVRSPSGRERKR